MAGMPAALPSQSAGLRAKVVDLTHSRAHELNGFLLRQSREAFEAAMGKPFREENPDNSTHWCAYRIPGSEGNYFAAFFFVSKDKDSDLNGKAVKLELTGAEPSGPTGFFGLQLGDAAEKVETVLGKPTKVSHEDDVNVDLWDYEQENYSLEFTPDRKLHSIQIIDKPGPDTPDPTGSADVRLFAQAIQVHNMDKVMEMVSGEIECSNTEAFGIQTGAARSVLSDPKSQISICLQRAADAILALGPEMKGAEDQMRIWTENSPGCVTKFPESSPLKEVVFDQEAGAFHVYEVTFR